MLKSLFSKQRIIISWLISYIIVLFIPILITGISSYQTVKVVEDEVNNSNMFLLKRIQQNMDNILDDVERLGIEITYNSKIQEVLSYENDLKDWQYFYLNTAYQEFQKFKNTYKSIDDFYIYFKNIETVISSNGSTNKEFFYNAYYSKTNIAYEQWNSIIQEKYDGKYVLLPGTNSMNEKVIAYVKSITKPLQAEPIANLVITFSESKFVKEAKGIDLTSQGSTFMIDSDNKVLASLGDYNSPGDITFDDLSQDSGLIHMHLGKDKVAVSYFTSYNNKVKYISVIPLRAFWEKVQFVRYFTILSIGLCLLAGGLVTALILSKNYKPVIKLIRTVERGTLLNFDRSKDEFSYIENALAKILDEKQKMDSRLRQQNLMVRSGFLSKLLKGRLESNVPITEYLASFGIHIRSSSFAVMLFYIEDVGEYFCEERAGEYNLVQFILSNVIEELVGKENEGYFVEVDDVMACIVNFNEETGGEGVAELVKTVQEAQMVINQNFKIYFSTAVSNVHQGVAEVIEAYNEAQQAMEYLIAMGSGEILCYSDLKKDPPGRTYFPAEIEKKLVQSIKTGDFEGIEKALDVVFEHNHKNQISSLAAIRWFVLSFTGTLVKILNDIDGQSEKNWARYSEEIEGLLKAGSMAKIKERVFCFLKRVSEEVSSQFINEKFKVVDAIIDYIQNHYQNADINISTIAEHFGMHPVYISQAFREQTGEGILDFIHKVRLGKAKLLLRQSDSSMEKISGETGYTNVRTFFRAFKKYEGINPGDYRAMSDKL